MDNSIKNEDIEVLISVIKDIVRDVISQMDLRIERYYDGIVGSISSDGNVAVLTYDDMLLEGLENRSGVALKKGDGVRVYSTSPTLADAYVGVRIYSAPTETQETEG